MRSIIFSTTTTILILLLGQASLEAQAAVSRFAGSIEKGIYESEYDSIAYATSVAADAPIEQVEGALVSRVFVKPKSKSNLEVFRSYERELKAGGFTIHLAAKSSRETEIMARKLYAPPNTAAFSARSYRATEDRVRLIDLQRLGSQADYYLVASKSQGGQTRWVAIVLCRYDDLYMVEELTVTAMETGTVTLTLDLMRSEIEESGKIAVYDIHFATGSAVIEAKSADALAVIASYLKKTAGGFYIVGHTDDTGSLKKNLTLSEQRAAAVKKALVADHGIQASRLETRGVGPLSPISNNTGDAGRALNRRVEIVQRLP